MPAEPTIGEYVIGVEGLALLRLAFTNDAPGRAARAAEIGGLLDQLDGETRLQAPVGAEYDLQSGYQEWVVRPGGRLVVSDVHPFLVALGWQAQFPTQDNQKGFMRLHRHLPSDGRP